MKCVSKKDPSVVYEVATVILYGDINGDGLINDSDHTTLLNDAFFGESNITAGTVYRIAADMNGDGRITSADAVALVRLLAGLV